MKFLIVHANGKVFGRTVYASVDNAMKRINRLQEEKGLTLYYKPVGVA